MNDHVKTIRSAVSDLENIQRQIGQTQVELLNILTDGNEDEWDEPAQAGLLKLEAVQRSIGEVQVILVEQLPITTCGSESAVAASAGPSSTNVHAPAGNHLKAIAVSTPPPGDSSFTSPQVWLEKRGIKLKSLPAGSGTDNTADRAALFLGDHFETLNVFYETLRRAVRRGYRDSWFSVEDTPGSTIGAICDFCTRLHGSGFLARFRYVKRNPRYQPDRKPGIRFEPIHDGRISRFFTGGWLERYVVQAVQRAAQASFGAGSNMPILREAQVLLPNRCDAEFDLLAGLPNDRVLWLECKTGEWQPFTTRLKELNQRFLKLPPEDAALVLVEQLTDEQKTSASTLTGMAVINLMELGNWLPRAMKRS